MRIHDALARFLLQLEADGRSPHTLGQYGRHVRLLIAWLGQAGHTGTLEDVTDEDLARFLTSPTARTTAAGAKRKASSANALRSSLKGFFSWLNRAGMVTSDPSRLIRRAITGPAPPRALRPAEEERLLKVLREAEGAEAQRDRVLIELMLATGIRLSSALALDVEDVDPEGAVLLLREVKGGRQERVLLNARARRVLAGFIADHTTGPVFPGRDGHRITARHAQRRFRFWREQAGIQEAVTPHSLRHAFAERLYQRTGDVLLVREALGHRSISATLVYAKVEARKLREAIEA